MFYLFKCFYYLKIKVVDRFELVNSLIKMYLHRQYSYILLLKMYKIIKYISINNKERLSLFLCYLNKKEIKNI